MIAPLDILLRRFGYCFKDELLLKQALTHRSAGSRNNERLEFLGDSILGYVIAEELYRRFPKASEGQLSRLRSNLVDGISLANIARSYNLGDYLILGSGELKSGGFRRDSILEGAMEAIFGAVYLDQGVEACRDFILKRYQIRLSDITLDSIKKDPKTRLQEWLQSKKRPLPKYSVTSVTGSDNNQTFVVECEVEGYLDKMIGEGGSRRKAEQAAASEFLLCVERSK